MLRILVLGLAGLVYAFVMGGLILHSQQGGAVFGRYEPWYAAELALLLLGAWPYFKLFGFLSRETRFKPEEGEERVISAGRKLRAALLLIALGLGGWELVLVARELERDPSDLVKYHPFLQNQNRPSRASRHQNSHGFRGDELTIDKARGTIRVFVMGGSTVYCQEVDDWEKTHVRLLEKRLRERYPDTRLEVQNAGVQWYTTQHTLTNYLFNIKDFQPDVVILFHGINDLVRGFSAPGYAFGEPRRDYGHFHGPARRFTLGSYQDRLGVPHPRFVAWALDDFLYSDLLAPQPAPMDDWPSLPSFRRNLESIVSRMKMDGVELILATQPFIYREDLPEEAQARLWMCSQLCVNDGAYPNLGSMARGMERFNAVTREVAKARRVPLVELSLNLPRDLEHFVDDVHYTAQGNAKIAELIFEVVEREQIIPPR